jgi:hypothetical protein
MEERPHTRSAQHAAAAPHTHPVEVLHLRRQSAHEKVVDRRAQLEQHRLAVALLLLLLLLGRQLVPALIVAATKAGVGVSGQVGVMGHKGDGKLLRVRGRKVGVDEAERHACKRMQEHACMQLH